MGRLRSRLSGTGSSETNYAVAANATLTNNGSFGDLSGWFTQGSVQAANGAAVLREVSANQTRLAQVFLRNDQDNYMSFTVSGTALVRAINAVKAGKLKGDNHDQDIGIQIALRAMEEPLRQIVENAGEEGSVVFHKVADSKDSNYGYNAATGEYGDMLKMGILDPTKVTRSALQHAASVAGLMITTEAMVAELPKEEAPAGGGGMEGMM
jgi:hypothetical protein